MNVVIEDGVFQGSCAISQVKQELSELENIIMEGDIILKVHAEGENEDSSQKGFQVVTGECAEHTNLYMHRDQTLVKVGDSFQTNKDFVNYVNDNAKRWCFYYKCTEAHNANTENETYTYSCVYLRNRDYVKKKGPKKRSNCKTDCPCKVKLSRRSGEHLTVVYVCNHHDHELSTEDFQKLQHNKKLAPYIKEIIIDLLALEVEIAKIRKFVEMETGLKMSRGYFYDIDRKMKLKNEERQITDKRLKELSEKMSVVDEMYSGDDDTDDPSQPVKSKRVKFSTSGGIVCKFEEDAESAKDLEASMNTDPQTSWMSDQSVVPSNRISTSKWDETTITAASEDAQNGSPDYTETEHIDDTDDYDYTQLNTTTEIENTTANEHPEYETIVLQDEFGNIINCEDNERIIILQQDENGMVQGENGTIGYFDGEQIIYMSEPTEQDAQTESSERSFIDKSERSFIENRDSSFIENAESSNPSDAAGQTSGDGKSGSSCVPVFDVYMKNGNVTGFVVNKDGVQSSEKSSQEPQDPGPDSSEPELLPKAVHDVSASNATQEFVCGDTYTKYEYIHRYNIDNYMTNPRFPKYIEILSRKTRTDVMQMLAKVYNEKAMFKMITTQKGKQGTTKIYYLTDVRRKGKYKMSDEEKMKRDKIGQYLTDILILKERVKTLKKDNDELITRNKYLEEVALRLAKMKEHN